MLGDIKKTTKRNLLKGIPWRFGPNWPGKRCEAKTIKGTPCQHSWQNLKVNIVFLKVMQILLKVKVNF